MRSIDSQDYPGRIITLPLVDGIAEALASQRGRTLWIAGTTYSTFLAAARKVDTVSARVREGLAVQVEDILGPTYHVDPAWEHEWWLDKPNGNGHTSPNGSQAH
ncbi:MAG: hypothetical protein PHI23_02945 [Candidatus Peribacteraceae bacterium]|nr:hypothetical protein [Candidatus Peribacteraceae bacterium]